MVSALVLMAAVLSIGAFVRAGETQAAGEGYGVRGGSVAPTLSKAEVYTDPYRRFFAGHWCNCWRKANTFPIDEKAMFEGILPRTDTPMWMKPKTVELKGLTPEERMLCRAMSGLVNRVKAMWYLRAEDDVWLKGNRSYLKDGITGRPLIGIWPDQSGPQGIGYTVTKKDYLNGVKRFVVELDPPSIDGAILYDPALLDPKAKPAQPRDMLNVVRTMCAIERALPLTPQLYQDLLKEFGNDKAKLPIIKDTTEWHDFDVAKFRGDEKAAAYALYAWAFNNFWTNEKNPKRQCDHHVLAYMPPVGSADEPEFDMTDYILQWKVFAFYSYGATNLDEKHMEYMLANSPMNIAVIGQLTDKSGAEAEAEKTRVLRLFSRFGKYFIDGQNAANLSMHSGEREKQRTPLKQKPAEAVALDPAKSYVAFCLTGNNSIGQFMNERAAHWDFKSRGSIPMGWAAPLAAADVLPNVAKFYYNTATPNDCFVADRGGLGLALPTVWGAASNQPDKLVADYLKRSKEYLGYLDLSTMWLESLDDARLAKVTAEMAGLKGLFYGCSGAGKYLDRAAWMSGGLPVIHTYTDLIKSREDLAKMPEALGKAKDRFCFVAIDENAFAASEDAVGMIAAAAKALDAKFVVVRPDQLAALVAEAAKANQLPAGAPKLTASNEGGLTLKPVADGAVKVDGMTTDWTAGATAYVTRDGRTVQARPADAEIAAEVTAAYDSRYLYLLARVHDREIIVDDANLTAGDHLVVNVDTRTGAFREPAMTEGFYRLALVPAAGLVKNPKLVLEYPTYDVGLVSMNRDGIQESLSSVPAKDGYMIEAAIPLANFPKGNFKPGSDVAIGFAVHDLNSRTGQAADAAGVSAL
jgi:hypothetical protein